MATFVVCARCGNVQETSVLDQLPEGWRRAIGDLYCPHCTSAEAPGDVLDEKVICPPDGAAAEDTLAEDYCEVCIGPCQGH